jgi:hypothetical protein
VPFRVTGKSGSVEVTLIPAPRGVDLAAGDVAKTILQMAGIEDAWSKVKGNTQTTLNFAMAVFDALKKTNAVQASRTDLDKLGVTMAETGAIEIRRPEEEEVPEEKITKELKKEGADEEEIGVVIKGEAEDIEAEEEAEEEEASGEEPEEKEEASGEEPEEKEEAEAEEVPQSEEKPE